MPSKKTPDVTSPWMDTAQAAAYLRCAEGTLRVWRATGKGPRYGVIHNKAIRYNIEDLNNFFIRKGGEQSHASG